LFLALGTYTPEGIKNKNNNNTFSLFDSLLFITGLKKTEQKITKKHWDTAYLRQGTSYQCRDTDPDRGPERRQNVIICSLAPLPTFPENCMQIRLGVFRQSR